VRLSAATAGVHLAALWGFAVLKPLLDVVADDPAFFIARRVAGWPFIVALLIFALVPPLVLLGLELLAGLVSPRARAVLHVAFMGALAAALGLYVLRKTHPAGVGASLVICLVVGVVAAIAYQRAAAVRLFLTMLSPFPVVFLLLFLFASPAEHLIFPVEDAVAKRADTRSPVVMVVFDEFPVTSLMGPDGRIDARRFPNFARLARGSDWYRNTVTAADQTEDAVPALLSGERAKAGQVPTLADHPDNLFTWLRRSHTVNASEHLTELCPPDICPSRTSLVRREGAAISAMSLIYAHIVAPKKIADLLPEAGRSWGEALATEDPSVTPSTDVEAADLSRNGDLQFAEFLKSIHRPARGARPPLDFLHSSLPHMAWKYLPSGKVYDSIQTLLPGLSEDEFDWDHRRELVLQGYQRHLLQVMYVDRLLGRLVARLRREGLYDRSTFAVVADHGGSFETGGERRPVNRKNAADIGFVPFFVKRPGQRMGRIHEQTLQSIDMLPTIADAAGTSLPWKTDGRPARELTPGMRRVMTIHRQPDSQVRMGIDRLKRLRAQTLRRQIRLFGLGPGDPRLYAVGVPGRVIGQSLAQLRAEGARPAASEIDDADRLRDVDLRARFLPALAMGRLTGAGARGVRHVAVLLNGRVAGAGPTYQDDGETRFSVVMRQRGFRQGRNRVSVVALRG
jgi:sulfatase-like protein